MTSGDRITRILTVLQFFCLGAMLGLILGASLNKSPPPQTEIEFINAFNGNRTILHLKPNGRGVIEEWTNKTAEELNPPLTVEEFKRLQEQLKKQKSNTSQPISSSGKCKWCGGTGIETFWTKTSGSDCPHCKGTGKELP